MAVSRRPAVCRRLLFAGMLVGFGALAAAAQTPTPSDAPPAADAWLPDGAVFTLHVNRPAALLGLLPDRGTLDPGLRMLLETLGRQAGQDVMGLIRKFTGGGLTFAVYPGDSSVWILDADDAIALGLLQEFARVAAAAPSTRPGAAFYQEYPGKVAVWSFDGRQFFARSGKRLLLANRGETLKALFAPHPQSSLASSQSYRRARQAAGAGDAWVYFNLEAINRYPPVRKWMTAAAEPFDLILNGAWKQSSNQATWAGVRLDVEGRIVRFHLCTDGGLPGVSTATLFSLPRDGGILPNLSVPHQLAAATLWRDLGMFYDAKDALFPLRTSGGILAENFMEIFFTGANLSREVFHKIHPQVRLVVARQRYEALAGTPEEQYPAAALVFQIDDAASFGEALEEAWQKAVGLTNFTRGQQAQPGLILDRQSYGGLTFTYGYFSQRNEKDRAHLPSRFNLRPAIARAGSYVILSTTDALARDLIDAVNREDGRTPAEQSDAHTLLEITSPGEIAALLRANQAAMVRQSVLSSGKKPEQAAREFEQNAGWLDRFVRATLSISAGSADLALELK